MKTKQSVYIIVMKDGTHVKIDTRIKLTDWLRNTTHTKIEQIYRAVPMAFQTQTVSRLVAVRPDAEESKSGGKVDSKKTD